MCTGTLPFRGDTSGVIFDSILNRAPTPAIRLNPDIPTKLEEITSKALEKDRDVRYQHASDIKADLKRLKRDTESGKSASSGTTIHRWSRRTLVIGVTAVVLVVALMVVGAFYFGSSSGTRINSVAVLPFANATGDPSMEYLSDGITEGVIDRLSGLPTVKVISRTSAFHFKGRDIEPQKVAKELGVDALVTGRVVQRGDDLSVSAELVDAREDKQLWGEQYSRKLADITSVQKEIATAISGNLRVRLTSEDKTRLAKSSATNPEAYRLYLQGRYFANQATAAGLKMSIEYFEQTIDKDPGYALAYAGLADTYCQLGGEYEFSPATQVLPKAKAAAQKALELDDALAEAHAALAYAEFFDWDWLNVEREFKRAIELNPNNALSHRRYGETLQARARFSEALAEGTRAQELDPLSPDIVVNLGFTHLQMQHYDESIAQFRKVLDLKSNVPVAHAFTAVAYAMKGMHREALAEYDQISDQDKAVAPETQLIADTLGWIYAVSGRRADALKIALEFRQLSTHAYVDSYSLGTIYAGLGEKDEAFRLLETAYNQHSPEIVFLAVDPFWYGMRSDPRYADLLRRIGLPQPAER
jgi:TolB-like protein/Flp pilus assembly protein TadD